MMPRMKVQPKIWIRTKSLAIGRHDQQDQAERPTRPRGIAFHARSARAQRGGARCGHAPSPQRLCPSRPCGRIASTTTMMRKVNDHRVGRHVDRAELLGEADDQRAERRARDRAHAADDDDHQRGEQEPRVLARRAATGRCRRRRPRCRQARRRRRRPPTNTDLDPHAGRRQHVAVVDAGADQHADARPVERQPHRHADHDGGDEDDEPHQRIVQVHRLAVATSPR